MTEYEWTVEEQDGDLWMQVASGLASNESDAMREANHYAYQYAQDGAVRVTVFVRDIKYGVVIGG